MTPDELADHVVRLRNEAGISLRKLAQKADISPASLSAIERGQSSPTLATLHKLLKALGTNFAEFFVNCDALAGPPVFSAGAMHSATDANRKYTLLFLPRDDFRFEMLREVISPTEGESEWETHDCDLGGTILKGGPVRLEIEDIGQWDLREGDAFYIKAGQKHRATNLGEKPLELITVMDPPRY